MKKLQTVSWLAFTAFVGALFFGIRETNTPILDLEIRTYLYIIFLLILRFKMALDNNFYFGATIMSRWQSVVGLMFGLVSWVLYIFSAYSLSNIADSYLLLLIAIGVSTLWIVVTAINEGFYREQVIWIATNAIYMVVLGFLLWNEDTSSYPKYEWIDKIVTSTITPIVAIAALLLTVLFDFKHSKSMEHAKE